MKRALLSTAAAAAVALLADPLHAQAFDPNQDVWISGIEVTQGYQQYDPSTGGGNTIDLIEGNATIARVYVHSLSHEFFIRVTGTLTLSAEGVVIAELTPDYPGAVTALNGVLVPDREVAESTLNFRLPDDLPEFLDLKATVHAVGILGEKTLDNNEYTDSALAVCGSAPEIAYLPIDYNPDDECSTTVIGLPDEELIRPGVGDDFYYAIFPIPDDRSRYHKAPFDSLSWDELIDDSSSDLLDELEDCRELIEPCPDLLYAWFRGNPFDGNGQARRGGNVAFGNTTDGGFVAICKNNGDRFQRTMAHEIGHCFGQRHPSKSGYSSLLDQIGFDVDDLLQLGQAKSDATYDIMSGGKLTPEAWINGETYGDLEDNDLVRCSADSGGAALKTYVAGSLEVLGPGVFGGALKPAFHLSTSARVGSRAAFSELAVQVRSSSGAILEHEFLHALEETDCEQGPPTKDGFALTLPYHGDAAAIELVQGEQILHAIVRSPSAPLVQVTQPAPGSVLGAPFVLQWAALDLDGDSLSAMVRYTHDDGESFTPLGTRITDGSLLVDPASIPGSAAGRIQVLVSDGLNTTVAELGPLVVLPFKAPVDTHIVEPREGRSFFENELIDLHASAFDYEDGVLDGAALRWTSDLDGLLGTGPDLQVRLSPGLHVLRLEATDESGATVERQTTVRVANLHLVHSPLVADAPIDLVAAGASDGQAVLFAASVSGLTMAALPGGMCLELQGPILPLATVTASPAGIAILSLPVGVIPPTAKGLNVQMQAFGLPSAQLAGRSSRGIEATIH